MEIKERLRSHYHSDFIYRLLDQATKDKHKYVPVKHQRLKKVDIVLIKDSFVKAPNFPLAKIIDVVENTIGEVTQVVLLKANKSLVKRDISSIILLVRGEQPNETTGESNEIVNPEESNSRPKRQAAILCRQNINKMIEAADI